MERAGRIPAEELPMTSLARELVRLALLDQVSATNVANVARELDAITARLRQQVRRSSRPHRQGVRRA
jgi:hypothetical protein